MPWDCHTMARWWSSSARWSSDSMYTGVSDWGSDAMVYSAAVCAVEVFMPFAWRRRAPSMELAIDLELELELAVAMCVLNGCV